MFTRKSAEWFCASACVALAAAGCAAQRSADAPQAAYGGGKLNLGTAPGSAEMARYFSYPADGRALPPGSGTYADGAKVYQAKCVACHGAKLEGTKLGDKLIGGRGTLVNNSPAKAPVKTVESYWPYATTLFDYVKRAMPFNAPGSLSDQELYAVVAYILGEANIVAKNEVINASTLPKVQMPNRNGFVSPDPRPDVP
ncbi:MAG: cytochrome c [Betaproteobacteria bacterium]|nr:MAG: cytochrome c [Betaproteobacteria bacterium]